MPISDAPLRICLLGTPEVWVSGQPLPPLRTRKGFWLLCLLVLHANRSLERGWLAETLWPDTLPENALANLRRSLTDLRAAFGKAESHLEAPTPRTLRFNSNGAEVDVLTFDADPAAALELYRGPLLSGCHEEWVIPERQKRADACIAARLQLAEAATVRHQFTLASAHYRAVIAMAPFEERARRGLMEVLVRDGDVNAAIAVYTDLRDRLHREIAASPDTETTALYRSLRDRARHSPPPTVRVSRKWEPPASFLPHPGTRFVGRARELENLCGLLRRERCVTLVGIGGIGKTRLAIRAAEEVQDTMPDGVWFADLSGLTDASQVPANVSTVLGLREKESLIPTLSSRSLLLVLDNVEHLQTGCTEFVRQLLTGCPRVRILVTSHAPLQIEGERVWHLSGLSTEDALTLFAERGAALCRDFTVTPEILPALQRLCTDLDGIPLAIELAAARLNVLSVAEITRRLDERFQFLTTGRYGAAERHQSLRSALEWTWNLLSTREREHLCRLSVLRGSGDLGMARTVLLPGETSEFAALDALGILADKSLIVVERGGSTRYRLLDTIRRFSAERLSEGERQATLARLTEWCLELAFGEDNEPGQWIRRIDADWSNITAALDFCAENPSFAAKGLRLLTRLSTYCLMRGLVAEGSRRIGEFLNHIPGDSPEGIDGMYHAGRFARAVGDYTNARLRYTEFVAAWRGIHANQPDDNSRRELAGGLGGLGLLEMDLSQFASALNYLEESLALFSAMDDPPREWIGVTLIRLGLAQWRLGDRQRGYELLQEGITLARTIDDVMCLSWNLPHLARFRQELGDEEAAEGYYREALQLQEHLGHTDLQADTLEALGNLLRTRDPESARACLHQAELLRCG